MLPLGLSLTPLAVFGGRLHTALLTSGNLPSWLSFFRAGGSMVTDSTGKTTWAPENLLTYSSTFSNVIWVKSGTASVTLDGDRYLFSCGETSASEVRRTNVSFSPYNYAYSIRAKKGSSKYVVIQIMDQTSVSFQRVWFDLDTGTVGTRTSGGAVIDFIASDISDEGNGEYRVSLVCNIVSATATGRVSVFVSDANGSFNGTALSNIYIWDAQLERVTYETTPRTYVATTSADYYGPRFDYDPSTLTALGLLLEGTRTNAVLWNRDLTNAAWTPTNITPAKDQTGIDGVANSASKITATAGNATILQAITLASSARFQSAYVKRVTGSGTVEMTMDNGATWTAITVTADWTRVSIPTQTLANPTVGFRIVTSGDAIAVDFVQNENGTFASSPVWTTTAAVTRAPDVCQIIGAALKAFNNNYGTVIVQVRSAGADTTGQRIISGAVGTNLGLYFNVAGQPSLTNGTTLLFSGIAAVSSFKRAAAAWDKLTPGRRLQATGGTLQSDANNPNVGVTTQWLGSIAGGSTSPGFIWIQSLALYNRNLSNAELAAKLTVDGVY